MAQAAGADPAPGPSFLHRTLACGQSVGQAALTRIFFGGKKAKPPACANCKKDPAASVYCVDCKKSYCLFCSVLLHHPTTNWEKHSLEDFDTAHKRPVRLISPVLLDLVLIGIGAFMMSRPGISTEYFDGNSYCPALGSGRRMLAKFDANLFFYYKAHLSQYCDWEDSYWRFFMDTWVRGILTDTDAWLLIFSQLFRAIFIEELFRFLITPAIAVVYTVVAFIVQLLEWEASMILTEAQRRRVNSVGEVLARLSLSAELAISDKNPPPPATLPRKRPMKDMVEHLKYKYNRATRLTSYHAAQAQTASKFILRGTLKVAFAIRVGCMLLGHKVIFDAMKYIGHGELGSTHISWFAESTGMDAKLLEEGARITNTGFSDWLATSIFWQVLQRLPLFGWLCKLVTDFFVDGIWAMLPIVRRIGLPIFSMILLYGGFQWKIKKQQKRFEAAWKTSTAEDIFGPMAAAKNPRDHPAEGWREVRFSNERTGISGKVAMLALVATSAVVVSLTVLLWSLSYGVRKAASQ